MKQAENYTTPFFVSAFVLVYMALFAIWAAWGLAVALLVSWAADRVITIDLKPRS